MMQAMKLSREFFEEVAKPRLFSDFPEIAPHIAAGLVGNGSECFGYDDELSTDHDWGIDFFIWLKDEDEGHIEPLTKWKNALFEEHSDKMLRRRSEYGARIGVMTEGCFYESLIGFPDGPQRIQDWRVIPEENLALVVNGEVFFDGAGEFTKTREYLLGFYPEQLRLKKIAARCMAIAQTGQYNLSRCIKREDWVTLRTVLSRFNDEVISLVFLLNRIYKPYYKWAYKRMTELPILGDAIGTELYSLALLSALDSDTFKKQEECIARICGALISELKRQELASSDDWFMAVHGAEVQSKITDDFLRHLPPQCE